MGSVHSKADTLCISSHFNLFPPGEGVGPLGPLELGSQFAAIHSDGRTRDEGGLVGSEKHNRLGNLFGQTYTFKRHPRNQRGLIVLIASEPVQHPSLDGTRGNYVV